MNARHREERRRQPGVAVISLRRAWLTQYLHQTGVGFRHIIPQLGSALLPRFRPPLLLDVAGMPVPLIIALLRELDRARPLIPTLALIPAASPANARLLTPIPAIQAIVSDAAPPETLALWLRVLPQLGRASSTMSPAWVSVPAPLTQALALPTYSLDLLHALAPYGSAPPASIDDAASAAGVSRRLFYYRLAALRAVVGLPSNRRYRPPALATAICAALADPPPAAAQARQA